MEQNQACTAETRITRGTLEQGEVDWRKAAAQAEPCLVDPEKASDANLVARQAR